MAPELYWHDNHMVISLCLENNAKIVRTCAMIDSGATGFAFMDEEFADSHGLSSTPLQQKYELEVFDGRTALSGAVTDLVVGDMITDQHPETQAPFFLTKLGHYLLKVRGKMERKRHMSRQMVFSLLDCSSPKRES